MRRKALAGWIASWLQPGTRSGPLRHRVLFQSRYPPDGQWIVLNGVDMQQRSSVIGVGSAADGGWEANSRARGGPTNRAGHPTATRSISSPRSSRRTSTWGGCGSTRGPREGRVMVSIALIRHRLHVPNRSRRRRVRLAHADRLLWSRPRAVSLRYVSPFRAANQSADDDYVSAKSGGGRGAGAGRVELEIMDVHAAASHWKSSTTISSSTDESIREKNTVRPSRDALSPKLTQPRFRATVDVRCVANSK